MALINISKPTQQQIVHGLERVIAVFVVSAAGVLKFTNDPTSKATLTAAGLAGATAVYQLIISTLTNL